MHDITVLGALCARLSGPITPRNVPDGKVPVPGGSVPPAGTPTPADDDALLAMVLITSWSLATGRTLRSDVPPQLLTEDELIAFWADDQGPVPPADAS
jgi:hypothetical protein